jgi:hypothetical protein
MTAGMNFGCRVSAAAGVYLDRDYKEQADAPGDMSCADLLLVERFGGGGGNG